MQAAIRVLEVKAESGISEMDLQPLIRALEVAEKVARMKGGFQELTDAKALFVTFQKQVKAKADLDAAVASKDRLKLRSALDAAEDLDMQIAVMTKAREILKDLEAVNRQLAGSSNSSAPAAPQPYDAAEEARKMRQEIAKQARFDIKNCPNLRTADDVIG